VVYVVFTWIRGGLTGWYPYAFLDPSLGGWGAMLPILGVVLLAFLLVATVLHVCAGRLAARRALSDQESRAAVSSGPGSR
ncbi:Pr6Pr family membrane protein, partial [Enterobacter quasiroggenkampii]